MYLYLQWGEIWNIMKYVMLHKDSLSQRTYFIWKIDSLACMKKCATRGLDSWKWTREYHSPIVRMLRAMKVCIPWYRVLGPGPNFTNVNSSVGSAKKNTFLGASSFSFSLLLAPVWFGLMSYKLSRNCFANSIEILLVSCEFKKLSLVIKVSCLCSITNDTSGES